MMVLCPMGPARLDAQSTTWGRPAGSVHSDLLDASTRACISLSRTCLEGRSRTYEQLDGATESPKETFLGAGQSIIFHRARLGTAQHGSLDASGCMWRSVSSERGANIRSPSHKYRSRNPRVSDTTEGVNSTFAAASRKFIQMLKWSLRGCPLGLPWAKPGGHPQALHYTG